MTIDISSIPQLVDDLGAGMMMEQYGEQAFAYQSYADVRGLDGLPNLYGEKSTVMQGVGEYKEREDGQEIEADEPGQGPTWYLKVRQFSRKIVISDRMARSADAAQKIPNLIGEFGASFGRMARLQKSNRMGGMLEAGMLTAGSTKYFDGSHVGEVDPNPGFIYTGLPWFDGAQTLTGSSSTYSNHTASLALTAANIQTVLIAMRKTNAVDERGNRVLINANTLVCGADSEFAARVALNSTQVPNSANNDVNAVAGALQVVVDPSLTTTGVWYVCEAGKGLRVRDSGAPIIETYWDGGNKSWHVTAEFHFGAAVTDWRYWYCANKAAS